MPLTYIQEGSPNGVSADSGVLSPLKPLSADYTEFSSRVRQLIDSWKVEIDATEYRRRARMLSVNVQDLRAKKQLKPDETVIPIRLIDTNIKREQPARIAFLKQSPRIAIFKDPVDPSSNNDIIESEFTRVNQYQSWELPYFKCDDGAATHGWDSIELELDYNNPGGFKWDHVGHDNLIFALDSKNFQANEIVIRIVPATVQQLREFVGKYGFDATETEKVILGVDKSRQQQTPSNDVPTADALRIIYKVFNREGGIVKVSWFGYDCETWLLAPKPLFLGVRHQETTTVNVDVSFDLSGQVIQEPKETTTWVQDFEVEFPFVLQMYEETEQRCIKDHKGRVFKDEYKQEALFAIWSSYVNACTRATNIMASPKNPMGGGAPKQNQNFVIEHGKIWTEPMDFWNLPYPEPQMLDAAQKLDVQNSEETNQVNFAVNNRKDSRKTATEIDAATQQNTLISGVNVTMYSVFIREGCQKSWRIVKSLAQQGKIMFCIQRPELIDKEWEIFAAGDVDVVQRAEKSQRQLTMWPIIATTPLAMTFLIDILKNAFPDDAARYELELREFQKMQQQQTLMRNLQAIEIAKANRVGSSVTPAGANQQAANEQQITEQTTSSV